MTDSFSVGDTKKTSNITSDVGKSPLEQSVDLPDQDKSQPAPQPKPVEPIVPSSTPPVESKPESPQPSPSSLSSPGLDLPTGVQPKEDGATNAQETPVSPSTPASNPDSAPTPTPTPTFTPTASTDIKSQPPKDDFDASGTGTNARPYMDNSNVLHEKQDDLPKQEQVASSDPAVLDALSSFDKEKEGESKKQEESPDLGEPAKAPDTDDFLKSILSDQENTTEENSDNNKTVTTNNPKPPETPYKPAPSFKEQEREEPLPSAPSLNEKAPIDGRDGQIGGSKPIAGVGIDSISGAEPEIAEADGMLKTNKPTAKGNSFKMVLAIILAVGVVVAGYFVYKALFPSESQIETSDLYDSNEGAEYGESETTELYATDDEQRKADLDSIKEALLNYYAGEGQFPVSETLMLLVSGNALESKLVPTYLSLLPEDPSMSKSYGYKSDGMTFTLTAVLDDTTDPEATVEGGKAIYNVIYDPSSTGSSSSSEKSTVTATVVPTSTSTEDINSILNY